MPIVFMGVFVPFHSNSRQDYYIANCFAVMSKGLESFQFISSRSFYKKINQIGNTITATGNGLTASRPGEYSDKRGCVLL